MSARDIWWWDSFGKGMMLTELIIGLMVHVYIRDSSSDCSKRSVSANFS